MSTIKVNEIKDYAGTTTLAKLDTGVLSGVLSPMGMRNRIINGDMRIAQRGATFSSGVGVLTYTLDRWTVAAAGAAVSVSASADPFAPYISYMGITGAAGNTLVGIRQRIEWLNTADLAGQTVTVSFYCYNATSNATSATVQLNYPTAKDNYASTTSSATQTIALSNTGRQSFTFTVPAAAANGIELNVFVNNLTSGVLVFREVQLEKGSVATPFEFRSIGQELALCERYYEKGYESAGSRSGDNLAIMCVHFRTEKRTSPTMTFTSLQGGAITLSSANVSAAEFYNNPGSGSNGRANTFASAEL